MAVCENNLALGDLANCRKELLPFLKHFIRIVIKALEEIIILRKIDPLTMLPLVARKVMIK